MNGTIFLPRLHELCVLVLGSPRKEQAESRSQHHRPKSRRWQRCERKGCRRRIAALKQGRDDCHERALTLTSCRSAVCRRSSSSSCRRKRSNFASSTSRMSSNIAGCTFTHCSMPAADLRIRGVMSSPAASRLTRATSSVCDFDKSSRCSRSARSERACVRVGSSVPGDSEVIAVDDGIESSSSSYKRRCADG